MPRWLNWVRPRRTGNLLPASFFRRLRGLPDLIVTYPVPAAWSSPLVTVAAFGPSTALSRSFKCVCQVVKGVTPVGSSAAVVSVSPVAADWFVTAVTVGYDANFVAGVVVLGAAWTIPAVTVDAAVPFIASVSPVVGVWFMPSVTSTGLGPELIVNGTFTGNANGWTLSNMLYNSNHIEWDTFGIPGSAIQNTTSFSSALTYRLSVDVIARGGTTWIQFNGTNTQQITTTGVQSWDLVPASTGLLKFNGTGITANMTLDDVSVKQIL